jgi:hypothetical protein
VTRRFAAVDPERLPGLLADDLASCRAGSPLRVAVDGPPCTDPAGFAHELIAPLQARGRSAAVVRTETFWRDASLRLEYGHTDVHAYAHDWLDADALRREVLDPLGPAGSGVYLPSLRDPATNRATRAQPANAPDVLLVAGALLFGRGLPFDRTVHLAAGAAARARRTPADQAWTLPVFTDYDQNAAPLDAADIVIRVDDPRHPAWSVRA